MLDVILDQLDKLKLHAQDIGKEIQTQKVILKKVNNHADRARAGLEKQQSELGSLLEQYRSSNKCWKDIVMLIILVVLIGVNLKIMQWKGWIPG